MENKLAWVLVTLVVAVVVTWMVWTLRQALIARRGPAVGTASYLRHNRAVAATAACAAVVISVLVAVIVRLHPLPFWPGAIAGVLVIIAGERRWPRPTGDIRSAAIAQRHARDLVPWFSTGMAAIGLTAAGLIIGACWVLGNSPDGRTISGNVEPRDSSTTATVATVGDFPGWSVGAVTLVGAAALLVTLALGCRSVAQRHALQGISPELDLQFRRSSIDRMVRIVAIAALVTTAEWYETARAKYEELLRLTNPMAQSQDPALPWIPGVCLLLAVIVLIVGSRPRLKASRAASADPASQVDQPV